jgi:hypothetical protein
MAFGEGGATKQDRCDRQNWHLHLDIPLFLTLRTQIGSAAGP